MKVSGAFAIPLFFAIPLGLSAAVLAGTAGRHPRHPDVGAGLSFFLMALKCVLSAKQSS